ncbi:Oidioi.mRNA.OKI2018_I69.chr1.g1194.t1.cds [Oikopleura dioica]|uniref:Oidioi.mRNA.OKI2018_I69.chr1.g1194.t1.cds n=1 Tax=Oikopleura dioica TaxID=34765 RepID=A0ABN7SRF0_OIKDI|nr:Oidioi.mRNA.OKI2018_I69.chr1.g1194.t1.cds [Oikopleura dioica]
METNNEFKSCQSLKDPAQINPTSLQNHLHLESSHQAHVYWVNRQCQKTDDGRILAFGVVYDFINDAMEGVKEKRQVTVDWARCVCETSNCDPTVFPHAVKLFDRVLQTTPCKYSHLQSIIAACMLIASKFRETVPLGIRRLVALTKYSVDERMIKDVEMVVLLKLHFDVSEVTYPDFYPFIIDILHASNIGEKLPLPSSRYMQDELLPCVSKIAALALSQDSEMVSHKPSIMAVCSLGVFLCKMRFLTTPVQFFQALCPFITTVRESAELRKCWDTCMLVWQNYARVPSSVSPTFASRPVNNNNNYLPSQQAPNRLPSVSQIQRLKGANVDPMANEMVVDHGDPDRDSGHYSNLD